MAKWQFMKNGKPTDDPIFDDKGLAEPGDEGFSRGPALEAAQGVGADAVNYVGRSDPQN